MEKVITGFTTVQDNNEIDITPFLWRAIENILMRQTSKLRFPIAAKIFTIITLDNGLISTWRQITGSDNGLALNRQQVIPQTNMTHFVIFPQRVNLSSAG